jgi:hypothetical protein
MLLTCRTQPSGARLPRTTGQGAPPVIPRDRHRRREELIEIACHVFAEKGS